MIDVTQQIHASADDVWQRIRGFGDLASWLPGVTACEVEGDGIGAIRTVSVGDGAPVQERLDAYDENQRQFSYSIVSAPGLDARANFRATVTVSPADEGSQVRWQASFDTQAFPAEIVDKIRLRAEAMYRACLQHLAGLMAD